MSLIGRQIGRYRILEQLGQGGMSVVYKGLDTALDREVAVKVLHTHLAAKEESRRRLAREAKAVARLHHPNILEVFDFAGAEAEQAFIVTEYIRGHTLRHFAETTGFEPPEIAAMVVHEVACALAHAHEAGIIHRDLKPENVMVRDDGVLKLMDFGIAKIIDRDDKMTMTGALVGSPAHMAPEIIEGEEAGPESDVFSLGTMLFYFATGRLPFTAPNTTATLKRILDGLYDDPRQLVPTVSDELAEIIATCLARQPSSRYANAVKLRDALADYLASLGLARAQEELTAFFCDPGGYRKALTPRLAEALVARSEALLAEKRPARALSALNQVLAHDPNHPRALALLQQMNVARKKQRNHRALLRAGIGAGALVVLVVGGVSLYRAFEDGPAPEPSLGEVAKARLEVAPEPAARPPEPEKLVAPEPEKVAIADPPPKVTVPVEPEKKAPAALPVRVNLRPYGYLQVDGAARSDELAQHALLLTPGPHQVRYGCRFCQEGAQTLVVKAQGPNEFHLAVNPLPSHLSFEFQPAQAQVRIGEETRSAADSLLQPFTVRSASGADLRHRVEYEVFLPGHRTARGVVVLAPGETRTLTGSLLPE